MLIGSPQLGLFLDKETLINLFRNHKPSAFLHLTSVYYFIDSAEGAVKRLLNLVFGKIDIIFIMVSKYASIVVS